MIALTGFSFIYLLIYLFIFKVVCVMKILKLFLAIIRQYLIVKLFFIQRYYFLMSEISIVFLLFLCCSLIVSATWCPNLCSGHGKCRASRSCLCRPGYTGPDCSQR